MKMKLSVRHCCIQTVAKKEYRRLLYSLENLDASSKSFRKKAELIDQLNRFLSTTDFSKLRAVYPELSGRHDLEVELVEHDNSNGLEIVIVNSEKQDITKRRISLSRFCRLGTD